MKPEKEITEDRIKMLEEDRKSLVFLNKQYSVTITAAKAERLKCSDQIRRIDREIARLKRAKIEGI